MNDRISNYRVVRLALHVPQVSGAQAKWSLVATGVKRGIPSATILLDGCVPLAAVNPTTEEILEAIDAVTRQFMLPR